MNILRSKVVSAAAAAAAEVTANATASVAVSRESATGGGLSMPLTPSVRETVVS